MKSPDYSLYDGSNCPELCPGQLFQFTNINRSKLKSLLSILMNKMTPEHRVLFRTASSFQINVIISKLLEVDPMCLIDTKFSN